MAHMRRHHSPISPLVNLYINCVHTPVLVTSSGKCLPASLTKAPFANVIHLIAKKSRPHARTPMALKIHEEQRETAEQ